MAITLKIYRGVEIMVREDGRFEARVPKSGSSYRTKQVVTKDLTAVERAIDASIPEVATIEPIKVLGASGHKVKPGDSHWKKDDDLRDIAVPGVATIVTLKREQGGRGRNAHTITQLLTAEGRQVYLSGTMHRYDAEVEAALLDIVARAKVLRAEWSEVLERLTPITKDEIVKLIDDATPTAGVK